VFPEALVQIISLAPQTSVSHRQTMWAASGLHRSSWENLRVEGCQRKSAGKKKIETPHGKGGRGRHALGPDGKEIPFSCEGLGGMEDWG